MPRISVVTSLYRSEPYIVEFYERCLAVIKEIAEEYEFIFVDDGLPDNAKAVVQSLIDKDKAVRLVELSRNFGHHKAIMKGLEYARGDLVFMLDSDLEEEPELLREFYRVMQDDPRKPDVVYGFMERRKGGLFERLPGALFYKIINFMSDIPIPANIMAARLMTQSFVRNAVRFQESHVFLGGVLKLAGYTQVGVPAQKLSKGSTAYTWNMKLSQAMDAIVSFTNKPLTYVAVTGMSIAVLAFLVALIVVITQVFRQGDVDIAVLILASLWFLGGLIIAAIGLVGFYVGRIFVQVKHRPNVIVKEVHNPAEEA